MKGAMTRFFNIGQPPPNICELAEPAAHGRTRSHWMRLFFRTASLLNLSRLPTSKSAHSGLRIRKPWRGWCLGQHPAAESCVTNGIPPVNQPLLPQSIQAFEPRFQIRDFGGEAQGTVESVGESVVLDVGPDSPIGA